MSEKTTDNAAPQRDKPWLIRTYSGHSSATESNRLYRKNLERGQTGLSVAFDLPTQTGYDSDHPLARGEVGKVGVPLSHLGDMEALFDEIPLERMNTSMTINATAAWLLALYIAVAEKRGIPRDQLSGTTQNDIIKEYLSRGTYIFPPQPSMRLIGDVIAFTTREVPKWNPVNICSYHLQEAGATPVQELSYALATAMTVLDTVRDTGQVADESFQQVVGRISFFVNAGIRFVTEMCKMRAFTELWDEITAERYGVNDPKYRRFRYGVQVNSLGLTEQQPENNVYRVLLEMLSVVLSKNARARAVQLPAWNEALGLPRPWDQQWSLRMQQIVASETDLLEYDDLFDGSGVVSAKVEELKREARQEINRIRELGGVIPAVESGYLKGELVKSHARRLSAIEKGEQVVVGVNKYTEGEESPLTAGDGLVQEIDPDVERRQVESLNAWRDARDSEAVRMALAALADVARNGGNIMEPSIRCAHAGVTTGEWADTLREIFGEYRAPTGIENLSGNTADSAGGEAAKAVAETTKKLGRSIRLVVGKPGLDGHSNGAEQIALRAREVGMDVSYEGIRLSPTAVVEAAVADNADVVGLSILSGSHIPLVTEVIAGLKSAGRSDIPVVIGGIIPSEDKDRLIEMGVAGIYTPKDFDLDAIMADIARLVAKNAG
ncbi:MAG: protein meaA [Rhodospirillales bacterium]|nr:protein meaA [Rhodospirillales bacterium]